MSAPAQGIFYFFSSITTDFNISSALRWAIQDQWSSGWKYDRWLTFMLYLSDSDVLHSHFHNAWLTIPRIVLHWFYSIPESFMPLVDNGHTAWIHYFWTSNQVSSSLPVISPSPTQNLMTVTAQLNVTGWCHHFWALFVKTLGKLHVKKQQSSNFTEMTSGRCISI